MELIAHTSLDAYVNAVKEAMMAAAAYYDHSESLLTDAEYDSLLRSIRKTEEENPEWVVKHTLFENVAAGASAGGEIAHAAPMLSLDNIFTDTEVLSWCADRSQHEGGFVVEVKLDGLSLAASYSKGVLERITTRGDGVSGENVSYALDRIPSLPRTLLEPITVEIRGEVLFDRNGFEEANEFRIAGGKPPFVNARNAAAGTLRAENIEYPVTLQFFAHGVVGAQKETWSETLTYLVSLGVPVYTENNSLLPVKSGEEALKRVEFIAAQRSTLPFEIDGAVIKLNKTTAQERLGVSARAPRWAIAYKYPAEEVVSTLINVEWTVGRTGRITPRAEIAPCFVGGVTVTYATLHNADDITRKDLRIGDKVIVKRAGDVVPRIEGSLTARRNGSETVITAPTNCPRCTGPLDTSSIVWRCEQGRNCGLSETIIYAVSRDCLDIEGMGPNLVNRLTAAGALSDIADLFSLRKEQLVEMERMGDLAAEKILKQIDVARTRPLSRVLAALGIRSTGRTVSMRLAQHFRNMDALLAADKNDLCAVEGIGEEKSAVIHAELSELADVIERLRYSGVNLEESVSDSTPGPLSGKVFVVTGTMTGPYSEYSRGEMNDLLRKLGAVIGSSVSSRTDFLVAGDAAGSKLEKAEALGTTVLTPDALHKLIGASE